MGRQLACVMDHRSAAWMERPERERTELPQAVVHNLELERDDVVADIGAGTGYFTFRMADQVPEGQVLAVDIQQRMLDIIEPTIKTVDELKKLNLPAGVDITIKI